MFLRRVVSEADDVGDDTTAAMKMNVEEELTAIETDVGTPTNEDAPPCTDNHCGMKLTETLAAFPGTVTGSLEDTGRSSRLELDEKELHVNNTTLTNQHPKPQQQQEEDILLEDRQPPAFVEAESSKHHSGKERTTGNNNNSSNNSYSMDIQEVNVPLHISSASSSFGRNLAASGDGCTIATFPPTTTAMGQQQQHQLQLGGNMLLSQLQRQYYSSSSLSGDEEEDDDEPLVQLQQTSSKNNTNDGVMHQHRMQATFARQESSPSSSSSTNSSRKAPSSQNSSRDWGWFEEIHWSNNNTSNKNSDRDDPRRSSKGRRRGKSNLDDDNDNPLLSHTDNDAPAAAVTAPNYVLEESLSSQRLWKESAGQRPPQPVEERAFYEKMWAQNFARSQVDYQIPADVLTAASPISLNPFADGAEDDGAHHHHHLLLQHPDTTATGNGNVAEAALVHRMNDDAMLRHNLDNYAATKKEVKDSAGEGNLTIVMRGDNVFGTTVSKSFARTNEVGDVIAGADTINISIASYRVVESLKHGKYAQFLVIYREGSIRDTVGIWKRYSDFEELANKVTQAHEGCTAALANISPLAVAEEPETEHLPNAITSWRLLKKRKRWYRCLDAGYLSLKVFLLERFLHDILFESSNPHLLRDFVAVDADLS